MIYTVDFLENKKVMVSGVEKEIKEGTFTDESGNKVTATIWRFDKNNAEFPNWSEIAPGSTLTANPWSKEGSDKITLYAPKTAATGGTRTGGAGMMAQKEKAIANAQDRKERSIHAAQDRTQWIWSRRSAAELVIHHPTFKFLSESELLDKIQELATEIDLMNPTKPF